MKRAMLSLNPDAASYTPLDKRITDVKAKIADVSSSHSKGLCRTEQCQFQGEASSGSDNHANEELHMANALTGMDSLNLSDQTKKQIVNDSHEMDSHNLSDQTKKKQIVEDSREMDLSYLTFLFPNISEQCLADVYFLNATDVESSIDMLNELESSPVDFNKQQPDGSNTADASMSQVADSECKVTGTGTGSCTVNSSFGNSS